MVGDALQRGVGLKLLLDTHAVYWWLSRPQTLEREAYAAIEDPANEVFVSSASVYEITFKVAVGKLRVAADIVGELANVGFAQLPLMWRHAYAAGSLPLHHRDPFDRLLVAQAQIEGLTIVTRDQAFADYHVALLTA